MFDRDKYPNAGSYLDRHGKRRWRYRRKGKTAVLPDPSDPGFDEAYQAAVEGRPPNKAEIHKLPTAAAPRSLKAAWRLLSGGSNLEWNQLDPETRIAQTRIAERFLMSPVVEGEPLLFAAVSVADLQRRHIKTLLARKTDTPHAAAHLLRMIRKLIGVALDEGWIENDPTYRLRFRPAYKGWKAWPVESRAAFEKRWPLNSTPRRVYALALYFGHRRSDVAVVRWADLQAGGSNVIQQKRRRSGRKTLWLPMHPELRKVLEAVPEEKRGEYVVETIYGRPFSAKALGVRMQEWTQSASLPSGHTLHGLRKTLGKMLAEDGATTRQIMAILGHDDIAHAELYTREAEQKLLAAEGMRKLRGRRG